jgi:hypothetical protein
MKALRVFIVAVVALNAPLAAQWLKHPTADIPRTADGKPDLAAPAPRGANGRPVLAGLWRPAPGLVGDMTRGMTAGETVPFQPWAETLFKERRANNSRDDPTAKCIVGGVPRSDFVGYPFKIIERPEMMVILYEAVHSYRQIFTDGRTLPKDPNPAWFGYSVGRWDGDALVVETSDVAANLTIWRSRHSDRLRVVERFSRSNDGAMLHLTATLEDPASLREPVVIKRNWRWAPTSIIAPYDECKPPIAVKKGVAP